MPRPRRDVHTDRARQLRHASTDAERQLWSMLRDRRLGGWKFRRQYAIGHYIADFACAERRLIIELDGGQHADAIAYDAMRTNWLVDQGYRVLRLWNSDLTNIESVREAIWAALHNPEPAAFAPPAGSPSSALRAPSPHLRGEKG